MTSQILGRIARELVVLTTRRYRLRDVEHEFQSLGGDPAGDLDAWVVRAGEVLGGVIYQVYYLGLPLTPDRAERPVPIPHREDPEFGLLLRRANAGTGWVSAGWTIRGTSGARRLVERDGITLIAEVDQLVCRDTFRVGDDVAVRFPKHFPYTSPGYYTAVADAGPPVRETNRLYCHVGADDAASLLNSLTRYLSSGGFRGIVKVINNPARFDRPDACTLYIERPDFLTGHQRLATVVGEHPLRPQVPGFAYPWLSGVGFAEEPPPVASGVRSFGEHRARIAGRGIAQAFVRDTDALEGIESEFQRHGLDPKRLYLNAGTPDVFVPAASS